MIGVIFWQYLKDRKNSLIAYTLSASAFILMYVALFPSIKEQSAQFEELFKAYPEGLLAAFGVESIGFDTLEKFFQLEYYSYVVPLMVILLVLPIAGAAIAGEIEKGTIENILAKPVSRLSLYLGRFFSGVTSLFLFSFVTTIIVFPLAAIFNVEFAPRAFAFAGIISFLFGLAVLSFGMMLSAIFSEKSRVYLISGALLLLMYVLFIVAQLKDNLEWLQYSSFFYYFDHQAALLEQKIPLLVIAVFLVFSVLTATLGAIWFQRRDIAV